MARFAAKLLFQFRILKSSFKLRTCEERIICFECDDYPKALAYAKRYGEKAAFEYRNSDRQKVAFEFVGVMDLLELGIECQSEEVWYEIHDRIRPMERRAKFIPKDHELTGGWPRRRSRQKAHG
jgi:hypothetical protein